MKNNDQNPGRGFPKTRSQLSTTSKTHSETERSSHKLFASPPYKVPVAQSNISSLLNQITTTKAIYRPMNLASDRKSSRIAIGYMNLGPEIQQKMVMKGREREAGTGVERKDAGFMQDIDKCLEYFNENESRRESCETTTPGSKGPTGGKRRYCNSFHEFGKGKGTLGEATARSKGDEETRRKERILVNEINCHKAKETEYIRKISYFEAKLTKAVRLLKQRKKKAKDLKCRVIKEQIMKENALGLIRNILENANDKEYIETMRRLMKNEGGLLLFQMGGSKNTAKCETKGSFEKKSTNDEDVNLNLSSDFEDIGAINRDFEKPLTTTMIKDQDSPNLRCTEILKFRDSELTLLDENFY